jgi:hypothetical protein
MADTKTVKHIVTNVSDGPKVLNAITPGILAPGDSTDEPVEMAEAEYEAAKKTGWFKFGAAAAKTAAKDDDKA